MKLFISIIGLSAAAFMIGSHAVKTNPGPAVLSPGITAPLPSRQNSALISNVVDVTRFGAIPGDGKDDSQAIMKALVYCKNKPGLTLSFPHGQYDLKNKKALDAWEKMITAAVPGKERWMGPPPAGLEGWPEDKNVIFKIEESKDLTIEGNGSLLMIHGLCQPFKIENCSQLVIRNFSLDYIQPPNMTGKITGTGDSYIDVEVLDNIEIAGGEPFIAIQMYDSRSGLPTPVETFAGVKSTQQLKPKVLRLNMTTDGRGKGFPARLKEGNLLVMRNLLGGYEPFEINEGENILLENIAIYAGAGMGIDGIGVKNLTLRQVKIIPAPGTSRLMSVTADGTHFIGCRGTVTLDRCTIMGEGDDHLNIHGQYHFVDEVLNSRKITASIGTKSGMGKYEESWVKGWTSAPRAGETVEFCQTDNLNIIAIAKIETIDFNKKTGKSVITFDRDLPQTVKKEYIFQVTEQVPSLRVSNCTFGYGRARGLLITTRDAVVENCIFDHVGGTPVFVCCEVDWLETPAPADIKIRNNTFINCGYAVANEGGAITLLFKQNKRIEGWFKNVEITDNVIIGNIKAGILAEQVDGLVIKNNFIKGYQAPIITRECKNIINENNYNSQGLITAK